MPPPEEIQNKFLKQKNLSIEEQLSEVLQRVRQLEATLNQPIATEPRVEGQRHGRTTAFRLDDLPPFKGDQAEVSL